MLKSFKIFEMLYLIGLGLNEKSFSLESVRALKKCKKVYLENYTSILNGNLNYLEKLTNKKIENVNRDFVENYSVEEAKKNNVAFLIIGDVFSATTHISLFNDCKNKNVEVRIFNNASIITAVGITGLSLYNFGKVASIPFENKNVESPIKILKDNLKINAHTLFLLDLNPGENKYLSIRDAIEYLERNDVDEKIIGCARLGNENFVVKYGNMKKIKDFDFGEGPYCLIVPAKKLHFIEDEVLGRWKI